MEAIIEVNSWAMNFMERASIAGKAPALTKESGSITECAGRESSAGKTGTAMKGPSETIKCMAMAYIGPKKDAFPLDNGKTIEKAALLLKLTLKAEARRWNGTWGRS